MNRKLYIKLAVYIILAVLVIAFIFSNSLKNRAASSEMSTGLAELLKPFFDPFNRMTDEAFHGLLRTLAHGFEFAMLGICSGGIMWCVAEINKKYHIISATLMPLIIAVVDELLQRFNDRASEVQDVLVDFGGAIVGIIAVSIFEYLLSRIKKKKTGV